MLLFQGLFSFVGHSLFAISGIFDVESVGRNISHN